MSLSPFHPLISEWFCSNIGVPTDVQQQAWPAIQSGADVLIADACASGAGPDAPPARRAIIERLHDFHASPQDCIDMAAEAGVGTVVLTYLLPEAQPVVDTTAFNGRVVVGRDLEVVVI